jgi:hypothetical protein
VSSRPACAKYLDYIAKTCLKKKKKKRQNRTWSRAQVVEHLPSKHKTLNSSPRTAKKQIKRKNSTAVRHWWLTPVNPSYSGGRDQEERV